jgi:hypothetical protein
MRSNARGIDDKFMDALARPVIRAYFPLISSTTEGVNATLKCDTPTYVKIQTAQTAVVRFVPLKRLTPKVIQAELMSVNGPDAFARTAVKKGHQRFTKGEWIAVTFFSLERV